MSQRNGLGLWKTLQSLPGVVTSFGFARSLFAAAVASCPGAFLMADGENSTAKFAKKCRKGREEELDFSISQRLENSRDAPTF